MPTLTSKNLAYPFYYYKKIRVMIDFWQQFFVIRLESERFTVKLKKISFNFAI